MSWFFKSNKHLFVLYGIIAVISIGLSFLGLLDQKYPFYALMNTASGFFFCTFYLLLMLFAAQKQLNGEKASLIVTILAGNFGRFLILVADITLCFLLTRFLPVEGGEVGKEAYFYVLIHTFPIFVSLILFYVRGKFIEKQWEY